MKTFKVQKGNIYSRQIRVTKTIEGVKTAYDLTGKTLFFTLKTLSDKSINDDSALIKKDITSHTDPEAGLSLLLLSATDTDLDYGKYRCDIKIKELDVNTETFLFEIVDIVTIRKV
jgi:hypothetical protein